MKKIAIITRAFYPSKGAGTRRITGLVRNLLNHNYKVYLFTLSLDFNYNKSKESEKEQIIDILQHDNFNIFRFEGYLFDGPFNNKYSPKRVFNKLIRKKVFWNENLDWVIKNYKKVKKIIVENNIETVYSSSPGFSSHYLVFKMLESGIKFKWVMEFRDLWIDNQHFSYNILQRSFIKRYEKKFFKKSDEIIVVSNYFKKHYNQKYGNNNINVLYNGFNKINKKSKNDYCYPLTIAFTGRLYKKSEIVFNDFLEILSDLVKEDLDIEFIFAGYIDKKSLINARDKLHNNFIYKGFVTIEESLRIQKEADILFLPIGEEWEITSKIFEYLATCNPILTMMKDYNNELSNILYEAGIKTCYKNYQTEKIRNYFLKEEYKNNIPIYKKIKKYHYSNRVDLLIEIIE